MNIFYQYSDIKKLSPIKGDFINEINFIKTLNEFANVNYGRPGKYDLYFVRGEDFDNIIIEFFKNLPSPKIWMAAPYNKYCYRRASVIATFSESWSEGIRNGNNFQWIPKSERGRGYKAITVYQAVGEQFIPLRLHPETQKIRKKIGKEFIIGHFGRIVRSNYPIALLNILPELKRKYSIEFLIGSSKSQINNITHLNFTYQQMPFAISACDLIILSNWGVEWEICGCMKILEAAACGIPIICGKSSARIEFFGENYPFFHSGFNKDQDVYSRKPLFLNKNDADELFYLIELAMKYKNKISKEFIPIAEKFKSKNLAKILKPIFYGIK